LDSLSCSFLTNVYGHLFDETTNLGYTNALLGSEGRPHQWLI
jgi:hypothetical protein